MKDDTISRQAAIDALRYAQHRFTVADEAGGMGTVKWSEDVIYFAAAERALTDLPSAQPEQRWIPFSERRPWEGQQILVCAEDGVMWMTVFRSCIGFSGAWLPMPEPYKEDDNG